MQYFYTNYDKYALFINTELAYCQLRQPTVVASMDNLFAGSGEHRVCADTCPIECESTVYDVRPHSVRILAEYAIIHVYYEDFFLETFTQVPKLSGPMFLASVGGIVALFTGASLLSAVEVLEVRPRWQLLVVGAGPEWDWAKQQVPRFSGRLHVIPKQPYALLAGWTRSADWGFSLDKPVHGNYIMSLPNKLFDYIHAGLPVVASALPEVQKVVERHQVGALIRDHSPEAIATAVEQVLDAPRETWLARCATAAEVLNWEAEEPVIREALHRSGFISPRRRRA